MAGMCDEGLGGSGATHERLQIPYSPLRSLPVHRVAALRVDLQRGAGDRRRQPLLFFPRKEGVLLPPQDQSRRRNLPKLDYVIMLDRKPRLLQVVAPDAGRKLEALGDRSIE